MKEAAGGIVGCSPVPAPPDASSDTASRVDVGARLREVRRARRRTLRQVADGAGISESFLSQIERGHSNASVATFRRIAVALGVRIGDLFDQGSPSGTSVLRAADRPMLSFGILGSKLHLNSTADRSFDMIICDFQPGGSSGEEPYVHGDAEEIALVLAGPLIFEVGDEVFYLSDDDSIRYRTTTPHRVAATPEAGARVLFVTTPPTF